MPATEPVEGAEEPLTFAKGVPHLAIESSSPQAAEAAVAQMRTPTQRMAVTAVTAVATPVMTVRMVRGQTKALAAMAVLRPLAVLVVAVAAVGVRGREVLVIGRAVVVPEVAVAAVVTTAVEVEIKLGSGVVREAEQEVPRTATRRPRAAARGATVP